MFPRPTLAPRLKTAFPWYPAPQYRARHTQMCKEVSERCPWTILMPAKQIIPFQLLAGTGASFGNSYPTAWLVKNLQGETVYDLSGHIPSLELVQFAMPNRDVITLPTELNISPALPADTCLEMEIVTAGGTYYSEAFKVAPVGCVRALHLLTWRSCGDFGTIHYVDTAFTNYLYLEPETNFLCNPSPAINLEEEKRADGSSVEVFKRKETTWKLQMAPISWPVLDAISEIPPTRSRTTPRCTTPWSAPAASSCW